MIVLTLLQTKRAATPILKHFDPDRPSVIVVYTSKWAISAALLQEHNGAYWPVNLSSHMLKPNKVSQEMRAKEISVLHQILDIC